MQQKFDYEIKWLSTQQNKEIEYKLTKKVKLT